MLIDTHNRVHDYLRISLTDNCNLRCFYCMPEEDYVFTPASRLMQAAEISAIARIFVDMGITKIRLTGGEPLVRKDAAEIIRRLGELPVQLTLTTNATRLHEFIDVLAEVNVRSLNISLDTLQEDRFTLITRRNQFRIVYDNIMLAIRKGFHVKVNMVVMKGLNESEVNDFVEWTRLTPVHVRFIEFMPFSGNRWTSNKVFTWKEMMEQIGQRYVVERLSDGVHETAKNYHVEGFAGTFAVISTMSAPFCAGCNRVRLTADGKMKNCLFSKEETDILTSYRQGIDIRTLIEQSVQNKAKELGGQFTSDFQHLHADDIANRSMITIGG